MSSVIIFRFCIFLQSLLHVQWLAYSHRARRAPSFSVSWLLSCTLILILCVTVQKNQKFQLMYLFCCPSNLFAIVQSACMIPHQQRCLPSSVCVLNLTSCLSPHFTFSQRCGWRCQSSSTWHRVSTSRYGVASSVLPKNLFLLERVLVSGRSVSLWFQHILHF